MVLGHNFSDKVSFSLKFYVQSAKKGESMRKWQHIRILSKWRKWHEATVIPSWMWPPKMEFWCFPPKNMVIHTASPMFLILIDWAWESVSFWSLDGIKMTLYSSGISNLVGPSMTDKDPKSYSRLVEIYQNQILGYPSNNTSKEPGFYQHASKSTTTTPCERSKVGLLGAPRKEGSM